MTRYDVHAHCVPAELLAELQRNPQPYGTEVLDDGTGPRIRFGGGAVTRPIRGDLVDIELRLAAMTAARVDVQLVSGWIDLTGYALPTAVAVRYTRVFNDSLAAMVSAHPERLLALCYVPLQDADAAARELVRAVTEDGFVGAEIATSVEDLDLGDPALDPFWATAAELRCPILIHPSFVPAAGGRLDVIENVVGRPAATTTAVSHLVLGGVLERFPELRLVLVHGGGFVPWQVARWDRAVAGSLDRWGLTRPPSEQLRNVVYDAILFDPQVVRFLIDWAGGDHVVLGTDFPFPSGDPTPLDTLDAVVGLTVEERRAIEGGNVERLLAEIRR